MHIYRQLKEYREEVNFKGTDILVHLLAQPSNTCILYCYPDPDNPGEYTNWKCYRDDNGETDFLQDYYVVCIWPEYEIRENRIYPYLKVALEKENPNLRYV